MARLKRLPWRVLAGALLTVCGLALGWLWFRDSSFAAVERVTITGSGSSEQAQVRDVLASTATGMSTLRVDERALEDAVEPFASVAGLRIRADFPHDLRVEVIEHEPVATVNTGGSSVPATGGGLLLDGVRARELPSITTKAPLDGRHVSDARTLAALQIAAAAPPELRARSERLFYGAGGVTLDLRGGPDLIFGSAAAARSEVAGGRTGAGGGVLRGRDLPRSARAEGGLRGGRRTCRTGADGGPDRRTIKPSTVG